MGDYVDSDSRANDMSEGVGSAMELAKGSGLRIMDAVESFQAEQGKFLRLATDLEKQAGIYREAAQNIENFLNGSMGPVAQQNAPKAAAIEDYHPRGGR